MRRNLFWAGLSLLLAALLWPQPGAYAQAPSPELQTLVVELWPEFDRPETLVIYRGELSPTTILPTELTFQLPGYIETMHAVAVEQNGNLVDVNTETVELRHEGDNLFLTFPTSSPNIHFEYYDAQILTKQNQARRLAFQFVAPYSIGTTSLQVQEPFQAENFVLTPDPDDTFTGRDGLKYHTLQMAELAPGDVVELSASYSRETDTLSVQQVRNDSTSPSTDTLTTAEPPTNPTLNWGYVLIGAGVILLVGAGGYWWWSQRRRAEPSFPPPRPTSRPGHRRTRSRSTSSASGGYCYRCGTALRADADFCHNCGAKRRKD